MTDASPKPPLRRLLHYARAHRARIWMASTASVLNKVFDLAPPLLIGMAVDVVVQQEDSWLAQAGVTTIEDQLLTIAVLTLIIWGLESIFEYALKVWWRNLAQTVQHELRLDAYAHAQTLDMAWFGDRSTGDLLAVLNEDVNQLERFLDGGANDLLQVATTVIVVSAAFVFVNPGVAALALLPVPFILWGSFLFQSRIAPRYAAVREQAGALSGELSNNLGGIETIKAYASEDAETARINGLSTAYREANRHAISLSSAFSPLIRMVIVVGFTATLVQGGFLAARGVIDVGAYSVLVFLTQRLLWPLTSLGTTVDLYFRAMASATRVLDLLDTKAVITSGEARLSRGDVRGELRFEAVQFAYPGREPSVRGIDVNAAAGETLAVVGPTGAGKSTLVRLLLRLYDPTHGRVSLDGHDLRTLDLGDLRRAIGLVSQSVYLFDGTVLDNVRYGAADADEAAVRAALEAAEAWDFVAALPDGLNTRVGERGQRLSGGQAQRLSLARAILKDPPILVLDEATSAVDNETEAAIQRSLDRVSRGRTVIVIAHRLSTIRHADQILVLDAGRVVETGKHEALVARDGVYARLWRVQTGERARG